ncbi:hypothetical protein DIPPA_20635 [Diplonema papillatum]|nr:hypothetical protein DIPPA_20635 [Diplonema papillatum]KAJ9442447.1 hypothetical protein DIPPA_20635 [Diplonema papillatum]
MARVVRVDGRSRADEPDDERQAFGRWVRKRPRVDGGKRRGDGCGRRSLSPTWVLAVGGPQSAGRGGRVGGVGRDASRLAGLQRRLQGIAGGLAVYDEAPDNVSSSTYSSTPSLPGCRVAPGRRADAGLPLARVTSNRIDVEALAAMDGVGRFREVLPMLMDPVAFAEAFVSGDAAGGCRVPSRGMERHRATLRSCGVASDARSRPAFAMKAFTTPKKDGRTARLVLDARPLNDAMRRPPSMDLPRLRDFIAEVERHRFAMQCDGVSYFYQFPVDASISRYFGIGMKGCDMLLNVLCMGWSWAPCIAQRASNVLVRDLGLAWVDNFLVLGGTLDEAERNVAVFRKRAQAARVEVRAEGDDALWQVRSRFVCVGVEFDLAAETQRHRLDPAWAERWVDGSGMTAVLSGRATARQFAEVFGGAVWATDILAVPRCHFAALLSFAGRLGGRMVGSVLWTDASSRAWAALLEAEGRFVDGRQGVFAGPDADAHINLKEMLAFAEGVVRLCWAPGAQRCRIDNAAVVGAVAKGSSSSSHPLAAVVPDFLDPVGRKKPKTTPGVTEALLGEDFEKPYLTLASTGRNDLHSGNVMARTQNQITNIAAYAERYKIFVEVILVEWNPEVDRPPLANVLVLPNTTSGQYVNIRIMTVSKQLHEVAVKPPIHMPVQQYIGKNIAVRRAKGEFVLCWNADMLLNGAFFDRVKRRDFKKGIYYRIDRVDLDKPFPSTFDIGNLEAPKEAAWLELHTYQVRTAVGTRNVPTAAEKATFWHDFHALNDTSNRFAERCCKMRCQREFKSCRWIQWANWTANEIRAEVPKLQQRGQLNEIADLLNIPQQFHANAPGDFLMMSKDDWMRLRGYPEAPYQDEMDKYIMAQAFADGMEQEIMAPPVASYHQYHPGSWGAAVPLTEDMANRPSLGQKKYIEDGRDMLIRGLPVTRWDDPTELGCNNPNWGFGNIALHEMILQPQIINTTRNALRVVREPFDQLQYATKPGCGWEYTPKR